MDDSQINKLIDDKITKAFLMPVKKYGDTPTDNNQLTPKRYVTSVVAGLTGPGGSSGNIQYNNGAGGFGGSSVLTLELTAPELDLQGANPLLYVLGSASASSQAAVTGTFVLMRAIASEAFLTLSGLANLLTFTNTSTGGSSFYFDTKVVQTTNNTPTAIFVYPWSIDSTIYIEAKVFGKRTGGSSGAIGDSAAYVRRAAFNRAAGPGTHQVGATQDSFTVEDQVGWDCTISLSGSDIVVQVTGATNNNINWSALVSYYINQ